MLPNLCFSYMYMEINLICQRNLKLNPGASLMAMNCQNHCHGSEGPTRLYRPRSALTGAQPAHGPYFSSSGPWPLPPWCHRTWVASSSQPGCGPCWPRPSHGPWPIPVPTSVPMAVPWAALLSGWGGGMGPGCQALSHHPREPPWSPPTTQHLTITSVNLVVY